MAPSAKFLTFLFLITIIHSTNLTGTAAQPPDFNRYACTAKANGNYTSNSTYRTNLNTLMSSLPSSTVTNYGFSNYSAGQDPDTVNVIALCRGDVSAENCLSCVSNATVRLRQLCPNQREAFGWYGNCTLRYSDQNIFHRNDGGFVFAMRNVNNVTSVPEFNSALRNLTDRLSAEAAGGGSLRKFATGNVTGPNFLTIYGLMQCTPDLSASDCAQCLDAATRWIPYCCNRKRGGRVLTPSCNVRFEVYSFYEAIPLISLPSL